MRDFLRALTIVVCLAAPLAAQANEGETLKRWNQEIGFWGGYSPDSAIGIGQVHDRKFFELNGQYAVTILTFRQVAVKWVAEVEPLVLLNEPTEYYFDPKHVLTGFRKGATTYAGGVTPLGMQMNFRNRRMVQPYVDAHGGILYFTRQEPVPGSSQFNFTFNFGGGVQVVTGKRTSVVVGYKFHHISNNETAKKNPGIDNNEFYAGYLWRWR